MNYQSLLTVEPINTSGTRVTSVIKKPYGYRVKLFNNYITEFFVKLVINDNGSAKAHYLVKKNYCADKRYTLYFDVNGNQVTQQVYRSI